MAASAIVTEPATVWIVTAMTINALLAGARRIAGASMACGANEAFMAACKRIFGLAVVIERPLLPVEHIVAGLARRGCAQSALVTLVFMTGRASDALAAERLVCVAADALQRRVLSKQREATEPMIKPHVDFPAIIAVAALAIRPQLANMLIILGVARSTLRGQLDLVRGLHVAGLAADLTMFAEQREIRHRRMVEVHRLPCADRVAARAILAVSALVFVIGGVAAKAGVRRLGHFGRLLVTRFTLHVAVRSLEGK